MTGAGEHVRAARRPGSRSALVIVPVAARALHARGLPRVRPPRRAARRGASSSRAARPRARRALPPTPAHNDLAGRRPARCARRSTTRSPPSRATGAVHALVSGSGPTVFGCSTTTAGARARRRRGARSARIAARARSTPAFGGGARGVKWGWLLDAPSRSPIFLLARRRKLGRLELGAGVLAAAGAVLDRHRRGRAAERREADRGRRRRRSASGPTCSSACSRSSRPARSSG